MTEKVYRFMWMPLIVACLLLVPVVAWLSIPTSLFIADPQTTINGRHVEFYRRTPFGEVTARWRSEIFVHNDDNLECRSGHWYISEYQETPGNFVTYELGDWALPCIQTGSIYTITTTRQVLIFFEAMPLRPSTFAVTITPTGDTR